MRDVQAQVALDEERVMHAFAGFQRCVGVAELRVHTDPSVREFADAFTMSSCG